MKKDIDFFQFKNGDFVILTSCDGKYSWLSVLRKTPEYFDDVLYIEDYCGMYMHGVDYVTVWVEDDYSDSAQEIRYATKEEIQKFLDELHKKGFTWDVELKQVVISRFSPVLENGIYNLHRYYAVATGDNQVENKSDIKETAYETLEIAKNKCKELNKENIHLEIHFYKDLVSLDTYNNINTYAETQDAINNRKPLIHTTSISNLDYAYLLDIGYTVFLHENERTIEMKEDMSEYTDKEIKPAHNIQKLWLGNHFKNYFYKK